jgi:hypothetical protein
MKRRVAQLALAFGFAGVLAVGCGNDDDGAAPPPHGGAAGMAGKGGTSAEAGSENQGGYAGEIGLAGSGGVAGAQGGAAGAAAGDGDTAGWGGEGGLSGGAGLGGEGGEAGAGHAYTAQQIERGKLIVRSLALCGGCHTASGGSELGGNATFANNLGAPNLTDDTSGIASFSDAQVIYSIRNGIALRKENNLERHLSPVMPSWLFHNMTDSDALATVAFMRSLPPAVFKVQTGKMDATPAPVLLPSTLPSSSLATTDPNYAEAQMGKYLVSGVAQCVKCHSPASAGVPIADFFSGVVPADYTKIFPSNITPHATGIAGWTAADVATALKTGVNKAGVTLCGSMPAAAKGYGGMTDADAHAIGVYLTTIPGVDKAGAAPGLEPACP